MLEILGLIFLCRKNAANVKSRGRKPGLFIFLTLLLWLGFEFIFAFIGLALDMGLGVYLLGIVGAAIGGVLSFQIAKRCRIQNASNAEVQSVPTPVSNSTRGSMWVFACLDNDRVASMSMDNNNAQYYSKEHAIATVRSRFSLPDHESVKYVGPEKWNPPVITAADETFTMDTNVIYNNVGRFLHAQGHNPSDIQQAINTSSTIPNLDLGILLICVDMRQFVPKQEKNAI